MKKIFKVAAIAGLILGLASCGQTSKESPFSSTTETPSSTSPKTSTSPTTSSSLPNVSSSSSSSSQNSSSSSQEKTPDVTTDYTNLAVDGTDSNKASDGFFTGYGTKTSDAATKGVWSTNGTSDVDEKNHLIELTSAHPGICEISAKGGSSNDPSRILYAAKIKDDGSVDQYVGRLACPLKDDGSGKTATVDTKFNLPSSGKYYILSNANISIYFIKITYSDKTTLPVTEISEAMSSSNSFDSLLALPLAKYTADKAYGNFTVKASDNIAIELGGKSTQDAYYFYNFLSMTATDEFDFTASGAGTLTIHGMSKAFDATDTSLAVTTTVSVTNSSDVAITGSGTTFPVATGKAASTASFMLSASGTYKIKVTAKTAIYLAEFAAV